MCFQDLQIARATTPYPRITTIDGTIRQLLPANPRRFALILPCPNSDGAMWSHTGTDDGAGKIAPVYLTGIFAGNVEISCVPAQLISVLKYGQIVTFPLFGQTRSGATEVVEIIEILLNSDVKPFPLSK